MAGTNFDTSITIRAGVEGLADLNQLITAIEQAGGDVTQLRQAATALANTWNTLSTDEQTRQLQQLANTANGLSQSTNNATAQMERLLGVRSNNTINAEIAQINQALSTLQQRLNAGAISQEEFNRMSQAGQARLNALQGELSGTTQDLNRMDSATERTGKSMDGLGSAFGKFQGLLATLGVSVGAMELIQLADQFKTLEAKIKLATGEGANFVTGFEGVKDIADRTFTSVEDTGELFARITRAGEALKLAQTDVLKITESINQAVQLSGGTAESNQAAITQLIQGLQSGVVRGEEFNSIMEQAPRLAQAMADGLGVTRGQLRDMAQDGKLTSETVIKAVQSQSAVIESEFAKLPLTTANALTQLKNNFMLFVGDIDKQINGAGGVASTIQNIANGFNDIDPATMDAVKEAFSQLGVLAKEMWSSFSNTLDAVGSLWNAFDGSTAAGEKVGVLTKIVQELSIFIGHITDGVKGMQIANDAAMGAMIIGIGGLRAAYEKLMGKSSEVSDALMAKGEEMLARAQKNAIEFESAAVKAAENAAKTTRQRLQEAADQAQANYQKMANDSEASAEKQQAAAVAAAEAIVKANNGVLDDKAKAILAEQGLQGEIDKTGKLQVSQASDVKKSFMDVAAEAKKAGIGFWDSLTDTTKKAKTEQDLVDIRASMELMRKSGEITSQQLDAGMKLVGQRHKELDADLQKNIESFAQVAQESIKANNGVISSELEKQAAAKGLTVAMDEQKNVIIGVADTSKKTAADMKKDYGTLTTSLELDFEKASIGVNESFSKMSDGVIKIGHDFDKFKAAGIDASILVEQGITKMIASAKNKADFDLLNATIKKMGDEGKLSGDQVTKALDESKKKATELQIGLSETEKAYKAMGLASTADLQKKAQEYKQHYDQIAKDATASSTIKQQAYQKWAQAALDANNGVMTSEVKTQATARGYADVSVENGKIATKTAEEIAAANAKAETSHKQASNAAKEQGEAIKETAAKDEEAAQQQITNGQGVLGMMQQVVSSMREKIAALEQMGVTAAQTDAIMGSFMSRMEGRKWLDFASYSTDMANLNADIERQVEGFTRARDAALSHTQALSAATVSLNDIGQAELALYHAQQANIEGIGRMDSATLDNLKRQIDSARERMDDLANSAKATADGLEANLARLKGDDTTARQIEQTRKLTELQDKLNEAQKRGNAEEIAQLTRAIELQKQYNAEETRQADIKKQQEQQRKADEAQKQSQPKPSPTPAPTPSSTPTQPSPTPSAPIQSQSSSDGNVYASAKLVAAEIARLKKEAIDEFMRVLQDEIKRQAR